MIMNHLKSKPIVFLTVLATIMVPSRLLAADTNDFNYPARQLLPAAWKASWSPDSKNLVFTRDGGGIAVLELESGSVTNLRPDGKDPA